MSQNELKKIVSVALHTTFLRYSVGFIEKDCTFIIGFSLRSILQGENSQQMTPTMRHLTEHFRLEGDVQHIDKLGDGFINDTFIVTTSCARYVLQRKNKSIFTDIPAMMQNIEGVTTYLREKVLHAGGDPLREVLTTIHTLDDGLYYRDVEGEYWTMCRYIEQSVCYDKADSPELAHKGGEGIGRFQRLLADYDQPLTDILPGFHNMRFRFVQWDDTLRHDVAGRCHELSAEIAEIEHRRATMLAFWQQVEDGIIPLRITHNDTKISNILFDRNGEVLCMIDLDTVLRSPCFNDFGDAIRTYANHGREDEPQTERVWLDLELFESFAAGYLSQARSFLTSAELESLAFSVRYITFEQYLRFLMDYINGDTYYKIHYPEHNLVRARAQLALLRSIESHYTEMCHTIRRLAHD